MKEKLLNATIATMLVISLTLVNFVVLGVNMVTYASELLHQTSETNYKNVEFTAYFKTDTGDKIDMAQTQINTQDLKLYMQVAVKEEGYFFGEIEVADSNFTVNQNKTSNAINKIEGNKITLNQINAGQTVEVEVGIAPITEDSFDQGLLTAVTNVNLTGSYISKKEKETKIQSTKNVQLLLQSPYTDNESINLSSEIITNKLYKTSDEMTKRMVQVKVRSNLKDNAYPIKETNLKLSVPEQTELVEVSSQGTKATNGATNLSWERNENQTELNIKIENAPSEENKISWAKSGEDVVVVTYILPEDAKVTNTDINVEDEITLYDRSETKITGSKIATVKEEKDGTIEFAETTSEASINKGKIYSKEEKQIKTNTAIYVNYEEQAENINIQELNAKFEGNNEVSANVQYTKTTIDKEQMLKIFGEEGYIKITNANGDIIATLTKDSEIDENGNIEISYPEGILNINIETSKPQAKGRLILKHVKTIKENDYNRNIIRSVNSLKQEIIGTYNNERKSAEANTELKETETKASLSLNNNKISTQELTEIEMIATLKANNDEYDLYKNPTVKIQLPQEVTNVEVSNISLLYEEEMKISSAKYDDKTKTIIITLQGEQTKYHTDLNEGAQIYIVAKIKADELTPSKKSEITFTYTNENAISGEKQEKLPIKIESKYGLMLYSKTLNYNSANQTAKTIDNETAVANIEVEKEAKTATMNLAVLNNYETTLTNLVVVGKIPAGTFETALAQTINTNIEQAKVYYSTNAEAGANDNTWVENVEDLKTVKAYKIVLDKIEPENVLKFAYTFTIPEQLGYNQVANANFVATYKYVEKEMDATSSVQFKTQEKKLVQYLENQSQIRKTSQVLKEAQVAEGLTIDTLVTTGGGENKVTLKDGDSVYEGQTLHYKVTINNNTGADLNNVKATITQTNAKFYCEVPEKLYEIGTNNEVTKTYYREIEDAEKIFTAESLANRQSKSFEYEVVVGQVEGENTTKGTISLSADNLENMQAQTIENQIKQAKLKLTTSCLSAKEEIYTTAGSVVPISITADNISDSTLKDLIIEVPVENKYLKIRDDYYIDIDRINTRDESLETEEETEAEEDDENSGLEIISTENNLIKLKITKEIPSNYSAYISIWFDVEYFDEDAQNFSIYSMSTIDEEIYISNEFSVNYQKNNEHLDKTYLTVTQTSNPADKSKLKEGEVATYITNIENSGTADTKTLLTAQIPSEMEIQKITKIQDNKEENISEENITIITSESTIGEVELEEEDETEEEDKIEGLEFEDAEEPFKTVLIRVDAPANKTVQVKILAKLNASNLSNGDEIIDNIKVDDQYASETLETSAITYYASVQEDEDEDENKNNNSNNNNNNNNNNSNNNSNGSNYTDNSNQNVKSNYTIKGTVWLDKNKNGIKDDESSDIESIEVKAMNSQGEFVKDSNGNEIKTQTSSDGSYELTLPEEKYIIVFMYDTGKYELTTYNKSSNEESSDVVDKTISMNGNKTKVAVTNLITLTDNKENVDMGLIEKENFTLSLNKTVSKVTVQNAGGTKTTEYRGTQLAKAEIRAKHFSGTNLIVEYKIDITNNGDVDGYINDVVDYIPAGYKFSSDLNNTWFTSTDGNLHNNSLANDKISAGQTKTLTLILTKTLTENDTGLIVNTAEIANSSSVTGAADVNSQAGNKANGEDDISSANLLVSVSTGLKTACIVGVIISIMLVGLCVYMIKRGGVE